MMGYHCRARARTNSGPTQVGIRSQVGTESDQFVIRSASRSDTWLIQNRSIPDHLRIWPASIPGSVRQLHLNLKESV
jgi:hypothetical protein